MSTDTTEPDTVDAVTPADTETDESPAPEVAEAAVVPADEATPAAADPESPIPESPAPAEAARRDRWPLLVAVLLVLVLALGAAAAVLGVRLGAAGGRSADRDTVVVIAQEVSTELLRLGYQDSPDAIGRMLDNSTGPLRSQLTALSATLTSLLQQGQVASDGRVTGAAVERIDDQEAVVLVAAEAVVKNTEIPDGQQRTYRIAVTLRHEGDRWLASAVDFVG